MKSILTIGEILVEIMATDRGDGFLEPLALTGPYPSGAPAIFADQAARFGQPAAMIGCVGDDDFGRVNLDRLRRDGVDVSGIRIDPEAATGSAFVRYRPDGSRAFVFNIKHSASGRMALDAAARAVLARADHLHVMGTALVSPAIVAIVMEAAEAVKARGGTISFDPNLRPEILNLPGLREACETLFRRCDLYLPSGAELTLFTRAEDEAAAMAEILGHGITAIVHKRGDEGATYVDSATRIAQPGFAVEEVDPTGAGDSFGATFVSCWLRGWPPERSLAYAAASGALAVTKQGPMEGASSEAEIAAFLAAQAARDPA
ncbi:MAG: sugar kinase [Caulobacteraceae bacterium]|nr:sugar kinase [Caulobacter sp.]